ncbi:uncharacterized protein STEHIDRAFT_112010 [Stereum hirsutum FP-91666 SS1]|uniref:uncharacterized protein n=1 Tax=Stereum hirsutum (strain FP-91666) TaxID=721885 RepID=UPI000444A628|nr:uncharacterized protein STEHIDRAFT_112010 [Stereum hirsutum FP-91666 SS1]EIM85432.1 hypothetical protein STEHIDRAFT_112010 [Stereum hirsutum FP-91666 SS1]
MAFRRPLRSVEQRFRVDALRTMLPEILLTIMLFLPMSDIATCTQVCQSWLGPAILHLYRELDFGFFAGMLCLPFMYDVPDPTERRLVIPKEVIIPKWRWDLYKPLFVHTKALYDNSVYGYRGMTPESIDVIARSWYFGPMFPNLEHLYLRSSSLIPVFNSPALKSAHSMPAAARDTNISFLGALSETAMNSHSLTEIMIIPGEVDEGPIVDHDEVRIASMNAYTMSRTLICISLPLYYLTPCLLHILSALPCLEIIDMVTKTSASPTLEDGWTGPMDAVGSFRTSQDNSFPMLRAGSFPMLHTIGIAFNNPMAAVELLRKPHFPVDRISRYTIRISGQAYTNMSVGIRLIIETLAQRKSPVTDLTINTAAASGTPVSALSHHDVISYYDLVKLRELSHLLRFHLVHNSPVNITNHGLTLLIKDGNIKSLILNPSPLIYTLSSLTLDVLLEVARNCPTIRELGLFLDTSTGDLTLPTFGPVMSRLEHLHLGNSFITVGDHRRSRQITSFLSNITNQLPFILMPREQEPRLDATFHRIVIVDPTTLGLEYDGEDQLPYLDEEWRRLESQLVVAKRLPHQVKSTPFFSK